MEIAKLRSESGDGGAGCETASWKDIFSDYEHVIQQEHDDGHTTLQTWLKRSEKAKRQAEFDIKCNRLQKGLKKPVMTLEHMQAVFMSYLE
jgi:hypothetical protein